MKGRETWNVLAKKFTFGIYEEEDLRQLGYPWTCQRTGRGCRHGVIQAGGWHSSVRVGGAPPGRDDALGVARQRQPVFSYIASF
jgi:hypothetical protein